MPRTRQAPEAVREDHLRNHRRNIATLRLLAKRDDMAPVELAAKATARWGSSRVSDARARGTTVAF